MRKERAPFLINMWEVDFPCKAGLLRRKVRVCPLCTAGLCRKRVWFCRRLCLHLGYFRWPLQGGGGVGGWGLLTALQVQRDAGRKLRLYAYECVCMCVAGRSVALLPRFYRSVFLRGEGSRREGEGLAIWPQPSREDSRAQI